jgi:hypothetical protein
MSRDDTDEERKLAVDKRFAKRPFRNPEVPERSQTYVRDARSRPTQAVDAGRSRKVPASSPKPVETGTIDHLQDITISRYGEKF